MEKQTISSLQKVQSEGTASGLAHMPDLSLHPDEAGAAAEEFPAQPEPEARHIVVIFGEGPLAREVAQQAARVGFAVDVVLERPDDEDDQDEQLPSMSEPDTPHAHMPDSGAPHGPAPEDAPMDEELPVRSALSRDVASLPEARAIIHCESYARFSDAYAVDARHYAVILVPDLESVRELLLELLPTPARYIGALANVEKKEKLFDELRRLGIPDAELVCVRCPIGLGIGAESLEECSIAITAELIAARAGCLPRHRN